MARKSTQNNKSKKNKKQKSQKQVQPKQPQIVVKPAIKVYKPPKEAQPTVGGKFPAIVARTLANEGSDWNTASKLVGKLILSGEDRFHASFIGSLLDPSKAYPLPSPGTNPFSTDYFGLVGGSYGTILNSTPAAVDANPYWTTETRGTTSPQYTAAGPMVGRYSRYSGRVVATLETVTDASGQLEIWFAHDSTSLDYPVIAFVPSVSGNYTGMTRISSYAWTSNPFPFNKAVFPEVGDNPATDIDVKNMYYEGGSMLSVIS